MYTPDARSWACGGNAWEYVRVCELLDERLPGSTPPPRRDCAASRPHRGSGRSGSCPGTDGHAPADLSPHPHQLGAGTRQEAPPSGLPGLPPSPAAQRCLHVSCGHRLAARVHAQPGGAAPPTERLRERFHVRGPLLQLPRSHSDAGHSSRKERVGPQLPTPSDPSHQLHWPRGHTACGGVTTGGCSNTGTTLRTSPAPRQAHGSPHSPRGLPRRPQHDRYSFALKRPNRRNSRDPAQAGGRESQCGRHGAVALT